MTDYLQTFLQQFIAFIVPKGKTFLVINSRNKQAFSQSRKKYDYLIILGVLEKENDILSFLDLAYEHLFDDGRLIIIYKNYFYSFFVEFYHTLFGKKIHSDNWLSTNDVNTFTKLADFQFLLQQPLCFLPYYIPFISSLLNRLILYFFPFNHLSFLLYMMVAKRTKPVKQASVSIVIPARNEKGNIRHLFQKLPHLGLKCEVIFVEDHSTDGTHDEMKKCLSLYGKKRAISYRLYKLTKEKGKAYGVRKGLHFARGEILIIYDADMTVAPTDLYKFYNSLISRKGDFINGSRMVYPIETDAMQLLNIFGNKLFTLLYSWLLGQNIKDTLCGTKVFWKKDFLLFEKNSPVPMEKDPFGDFYLLLGATKLNLKIIDMPVRYLDRIYGTTNIKRFKNAWELLKLSILATIKLKMRM